MKLSWYCSMCGAPTEVDIPLDGGHLPTIIGAVTKQGWLVQFNGKHVDLYCSAQCAA